VLQVIAESKPRLPRVLGPWMATALIIGVVIGSGVFKKPQAVSQAVPEVGLALTGWVLVGLLTLMGSLAMAEIAIVWPRAGGNYVFLREGLGRWAGFLWGWVEFWIIRSASIAALASVFSDSLHAVLRKSRGLSAGQDLLTFEMQQGVTVTVIIVLALINARGTRLGGGLQVLVTSVKVGSLLTIALAPFIAAAWLAEPIVRSDLTSATALWPTTANWGILSNFGAALVGMFWAYHGWVSLAPVAEEIKEPNRNIPIAFIVGVLTVIVVYVSANVAYYLVLPVSEIQELKDRTTAEAFAEALCGPTGLVLASAAVMLSTFGALNGNLLVGPRLLYAMAHDRLAPASLGRLHPAYKTPAMATLVLTVWSVAIVIVTSFLDRKKPLFDVLTDYAMFGAVAFETLGVATIFVVRRRTRGENLPYRCPLYPWLPIVYVLLMGAVLANMFVTQRNEAIAAVAFIGVGAVVYWGSGLNLRRPDDDEAGGSP
jgi:amino acid transporter